MKFMIHSCNKRLSYVKERLIPSMLRQGIDEKDIILFNDDESKGNLKSWIASCYYILENVNEKAVWHLQDDIVICDDFYERVKAIDEDIVVNGFVAKGFNPTDYDRIGIQPMKYYWTSFQCVYIPCKYIKSFLDWFNRECVQNGKYKERLEKNKYDDFLFYRSVRSCYPNDMTYNLFPCLVDHVDYLVGGSIVNTERRLDSEAYYWYEERGVLK